MHRHRLAVLPNRQQCAQPFLNANVQVEVTPVLPRVRSRGPQQEQQKPLEYKVARLLALSLLASWGRRTPILGWFVAPVVSCRRDAIYFFCHLTGVATQVCRFVTPAGGGASSTGDPICIAIPVQGSCPNHPPGDRQQRLGPHNLQMLFKSGERLLGTERALLLAALGLVPAVAPWALGFLQLWRSRRAGPPCMPRTCSHRHVQATKNALLLPLCPCIAVCMSRKGPCFDLGFVKGHIRALQPCDGVRATGRLCAAQHTGRIQGCMVQVDASSMS